MRITRLHSIVGLAMVAAILCALLIGYRIAESHYPDRSAIDGIRPGLSHSNVVQRLGVMYDSLNPSENADMGRILSAMQHTESITRLCVWRVRHTRNRFWVGFDDADAVISYASEVP